MLEGCDPASVGATTPAGISHGMARFIFRWHACVFVFNQVTLVIFFSCNSRRVMFRRMEPSLTSGLVFLCIVFIGLVVVAYASFIFVVPALQYDLHAMAELLCACRCYSTVFTSMRSRCYDCACLPDVTCGRFANDVRLVQTSRFIILSF